MPSVTLQTIAKALGVSRTTVSNAYNRPEQLTADLRERIFAEARRLGYTGPDAAARSLRSKRTGSLGLLFTETLSFAFSDPYAVGFLQGLAETAERHSTSLLLVPIDTAVEAVRKAMVDGFCLYCVDDGHPAVEVIRARSLPVVTTTPTDDPNLAYVGIDDEASAYSAGEYLAGLGHHRVAVIIDRWQAAQDPSADGTASLDVDRVLAVAGKSARARYGGYRRALPGADLLPVAAERNARQAGQAMAAELLDLPTPPTAIVTTTDVLALGVLDAIRARGLRPGVDISVIGFDDIPEATAAGLTTVHQSMTDRGRAVGLILLEPDMVTERQILLPAELVIRASTGPAEGERR
ncbi:LacI family DNA-binding transcriptional regulator [Flindersiella endophytica]